MQQVFMIVTEALPDRIRHPFLRRQYERMLDSMPGIIDWGETGNAGTMLFFGSQTHAEKAREAMTKKHRMCSREIIEVDADYQTHTFHVKGPLETVPAKEREP